MSWNLFFFRVFFPSNPFFRPWGGEDSTVFHDLSWMSPRHCKTLIKPRTVLPETGSSTTGFWGKKLENWHSLTIHGCETKKTLDSTQLWLRFETMAKFIEKTKEKEQWPSWITAPRYVFEAQDVLFSSQMDVHKSSWNLLKQGLV